MNGHMRVLVARFGKPALVVEDITLARLKDDVDGVLADDGRELPGRGVDQISYGEIGNSDSSIDWGTDLGIAEIDLAPDRASPAPASHWPARRLVGRALIECRLGRACWSSDKLLAALELQSCVDFCRLCLGEICPLLLDGRLIGRLFDAE